MKCFKNNSSSKPLIIIYNWKFSLENVYCRYRVCKSIMAEPKAIFIIMSLFFIFMKHFYTKKVQLNSKIKFQTIFKKSFRLSQSFLHKYLYFPCFFKLKFVSPIFLYFNLISSTFIRWHLRVMFFKRDSLFVYRKFNRLKYKIHIYFFN